MRNVNINEVDNNLTSSRDDTAVPTSETFLPKQQQQQPQSQRNDNKKHKKTKSYVAI